MARSIGATQTWVTRYHRGAMQSLIGWLQTVRPDTEKGNLHREFTHPSQDSRILFAES
jgi:hypothetical protein